MKQQMRLAVLGGLLCALAVVRAESADAVSLPGMPTANPDPLYCGNFSVDQPPPARMRVLVTGGAGFIGYSLLSALGAAGHFGVGVDSFNNFYSPQLKLARREQLRAEHQLDILNISVCDRAGLQDLQDLHSFTHVVHLAAYAGPRYSLSNPVAYIRNNVECSTHLLETIRLWNPRPRLLFTSTSSAYGDTHNTTESAPLQPLHPYGASKVALEELVKVYFRMYSYAAVGIRLFTVYGEWGRPDAATYLFMEQVQQGQTVTLYNQGLCERSFTYVADAIQGILRLMQVQPHEYMMFNIGNSESVKVTRLLALIEGGLGRKAQIRYLESVVDALAKPADIRKMQRCVGFRPEVSIEEGVQRTAAWFKKYSRSEYLTGEFLDFQVVDKNTGKAVSVDLHSSTSQDDKARADRDVGGEPPAPPAPGGLATLKAKALPETEILRNGQGNHAKCLSQSTESMTCIVNAAWRIPTKADGRPLAVYLYRDAALDKFYSAYRAKLEQAWGVPMHCDERLRRAGFTSDNFAWERFKTYPHLTTDPAVADLLVLPPFLPLFDLGSLSVISKEQQQQLFRSITEYGETLETHAVFNAHANRTMLFGSPYIMALGQLMRGASEKAKALGHSHGLANVPALSKVGLLATYGNFTPVTSSLHSAGHVVLMPRRTNNLLLELYPCDTSRARTISIYFEGSSRKVHFGPNVRADLDQQDWSRIPDSSYTVTDHRFERAAQSHMQHSYVESMLKARFCLITAGDNPSTRRLYDAIAAGCVPIFLSNLWYPVLPFHDQDDIDWESFMVVLDDSLPTAVLFRRLQEVASDTTLYKDKFKALMRVRPELMFGWGGPDDGVFGRAADRILQSAAVAGQRLHLF